MNNFLLQKDLILGTALWGWGIDKSNALTILDNFVEKGFRKVDVATNYPINNNYSSYGQTINWLSEWIRNNNAHPIEVICKVGSLSNTKTNKCNLSKSFLLTSKALINEKLKDSLYCLMIHWDNRSNLDEIKEAHDMGLIDLVVNSNEELNIALNKQAEVFSKGPINAYKSVKKLLSESFHNSLETQMEMESVHISNNAESKHGMEGLTAFNEKRKPNFNE